jgi:D-alanyl-D-alanine carboxypeptidase
LWLLAGVVLLVGVAVVADRLVFARSPQPPKVRFVVRPELHNQIDGLVTGSARMAPGVTAYVLWPRGAWLAASGVADVKTGQTIGPGARMRLESVSKIYTAALILKLEQEGKLRVSDTVERWLPGLLRSYGPKITIRQLLTMSSGLISDSDLGGSRSHALHQLAAVKDVTLRSQLTTLAKRAAVNPTLPVDPVWLIRWAAWLPLLFAPGTGYHYSNLGYDILGLIAERAAGRPLPVLYQQLIFGPLGLNHTAYDPNGPIHGPHSHGYFIRPNGTITDTTDVHRGKGADGGIVSDAQDTGTFLLGLMSGKLLDSKELAAMKGQSFWLGGRPTPCSGQPAGRVYSWRGAGEGYKTAVYVNGNGTRVAVLLLNARHPPFDDQVSDDTTAILYCGA